MTNLDFASMLKYWPLFLKGTVSTIEFTIGAVIIGVILGILAAFMKMSRIKVISFIGKAYIEIIRGTPALVQLFIIYFGISQVLNLNIPKFYAAVFALGINSGAYVAEIIRAGIEAVDRGQMEAARSLGMPHGMAMRYIIMPQAIKNILPALGNEFIVLLKESSIVSVIGASDLMRQQEIISSVTYRPFEPLIVIAMIYFVMTLFLSKLMGMFERRLKAGDVR
ncbi:amino acid ABC transporter membrane protein, PAAT family (TC 3.A.1.3.-) [Caldanaerobius fijiensis DSM 17918]|uniref:Amino acid ABC transporter membrane protein, PAAT family (TC 3.A.1.3.-) n=1 Tax=Caldanaerobius fijiensis DSM 17918 TaxID=1121256 RepID=A0A1M4UYU9_9THEO|nr:amino acid ABC transporter permease [Caldanaerobius fijiensis]SHE61817.1 amino acid ABC transporter membrane protein, PAAT family (TC 3.A.1.3.-) [Caldanaerobius fijiensis DSM 17918]